MAIEASFTIEQGDFPLSAVFKQLPDAKIELDRVIPTQEAVIPYFWIYADDTGTFDTDLSEDIGVERVQMIDEVEDRILIRIDWNLDYDSVLTGIVKTGVTLLSGIGNEKQWTFEVRAEEQKAISEFQTYCKKNDIPSNLTQLHALSPLESGREYDLTNGQREALILGYSRGHFDSPRKATQEDLAEELGITRQAVSSRLQRGIRRLVASTLITEQE